LCFVIVGALARAQSSEALKFVNKIIDNLIAVRQDEAKEEPQGDGYGVASICKGCGKA
jgi:hypothetical protein